MIHVPKNEFIITYGAVSNVAQPLSITAYYFPGICSRPQATNCCQVIFPVHKAIVWR